MPITLAIAQGNFMPGGVYANYKKIYDAYVKAALQGASILITPELCLSGYNCLDALRDPELLINTAEANEQLINLTKEFNTVLVLGTLEQDSEDNLLNTCLVVKSGMTIAKYQKLHLPSHGPFDEHRMFKTGSYAPPFYYKNRAFAVLICEDIWYDDGLEFYHRAGVECIISINASPFWPNVGMCRMNRISEAAKKYQIKLIYVNQTGAQDSFLFDGESFICNSDGKFEVILPKWQEGLFFHSLGQSCQLIPKPKSDAEEIYNGLLLGIKDYLSKNNCRKVVIGVSGGIDSALVATLAVDAIGSSNVLCVHLPSVFSSAQSLNDAKLLCENLGCTLEVLPITAIHHLSKSTISKVCGDISGQIADENLQARVRSTLLMAIANVANSMLLATSNKSEIAVGYFTLYGDSCGAIAPIGDLYKTEVYKVVEWRNTQTTRFIANNPIPESIILREPTAELKPDQRDGDILPPYEILDKVLEQILSNKASVEEIAAELDLSIDLVQEVRTWIIKNEFKRRQCPIILRASETCFSVDRRYPITFSD